MAKEDYMPKADQDKVAWLKNLAVKLPSHEAALNISQEELISVINDAAMFEYAVNLAALYKDEQKERTEFKNVLRDGPETNFVPVTPTPPVEPAVPAHNVPGGIFTRVRKLINRLKNHVNFTSVVAQDLGITGSDITVDYSSLKPAITAKLIGGDVLIGWKKGHASGIDIYVDRGSGFKFLATDTEPNYLDTYKLAAEHGAARWKYKARYRLGDEQIGNWSDEVLIAVASEAVV
jgi:hypothetical protein